MERTERTGQVGLRRRRRSRRSGGGGGVGKFSRKKTRRRSGGNSRPHSRNVSSRNSRARPGSSIASSDEDDVDEDEEGSEEEDSDEDFFTGESDAGAGTASDYVEPVPPPTMAAPKSKGSSSTPRPRKAWMCEHCTFVNGAGTSVCTVCCRTSKHSRSGAGPNETGNPPQGNASSKTKSKKAPRSASTNRRPRYNSSDEEDFEEDSELDRQRSSKAGRLTGLQHQQQQQQQQQHRGRFQKLGRGRAGMAKSMTDLDSLGPRGGGGGGGGGGDDEFDLEQDAINAYYAVRMGERRRSTALMRREEEEGELRATFHLLTVLLEGQGYTKLFRLDRVNMNRPIPSFPHVLPTVSGRNARGRKKSAIVRRAKSLCNRARKGNQ